MKMNYVKMVTLLLALALLGTCAYLRYYWLLLSIRANEQETAASQCSRDGKAVTDQSVKNTVRLFLSGDVMLGRSVDQILKHSLDPRLYEHHVRLKVDDARDYVALAVDRNGPLPSERRVDYVWGDALDLFRQYQPDVKIVNLETAITNHSKPWPDKGLNDTLKALRDVDIKVAGAGLNLSEAEAPAIFDIQTAITTDGGTSRGARVLVFSVGSATAFVYDEWAASASKAGVNFLDWPPSPTAVHRLRAAVERHRREGDVVVASIHWGPNWGWRLDTLSEKFAHVLIDECHVDVVHGHSSHHIRPVEIYKGKLIAYGCGDFINDYEGIRAEGYHDVFRLDLSLMYFVDVDVGSGKTTALTLVPICVKKMSVRRATGEDEGWLFENMKHQCTKYGVTIARCRHPNANYTHFKALLEHTK